jgi:hypothetical protein
MKCTDWALVVCWCMLLAVSAETQTSSDSKAQDFDGLEFLNDLLRSFSKRCDAAVASLSPDDDGECEGGGMAANLILSGLSAVITVSMFRCIGTSYIAAMSAGVAVAAVVSSIISAIMLG